MNTKRLLIIVMTLYFSCGIGILEGKEEMNSLNDMERKIAEISACTARGKVQELKNACNAALDAGLSINEINEILVQLYAYCGFPRSLNALSSFMATVNERIARGIKDAQGPVPGALPGGRSIDFGTRNQTMLCGSPVKGPLFEFAPAIDEFLKAHLFGDIFARNVVDWRTREIATVAALAAMTGTESQLASHIAIAAHNGVTETQIGEILQIAGRDQTVVPYISAFPTGHENSAYAQYFSGKSYLAQLTKDANLNVPVANVTFEPGCRNNWHSHTGGQILIAVGGVGYCQERGKAARKLLPGDIAEIPPDAVHWHGAAHDSWFSHLAVECNPKTNRNTWLEPVSDSEYETATAAK